MKTVYLHVSSLSCGRLRYIFLKVGPVRVMWSWARGAQGAYSLRIGAGGYGKLYKIPNWRYFFLLRWLR